MALTDFAIRNAKPASKPQKLSDGGNLYLLVTDRRKRSPIKTPDFYTPAKSYCGTLRLARSGLG
jgi:hypothetical protein